MNSIYEQKYLFGLSAGVPHIILDHSGAAQWVVRLLSVVVSLLLTRA